MSKKANTNIKSVERVFDFNGTRLEDPGSHLTAEEVRDFYAMSHPELTGAAVKGPKLENNIEVFDFQTRVGTKG